MHEVRQTLGRQLHLATLCQASCVGLLSTQQLAMEPQDDPALAIHQHGVTKLQQVCIKEPVQIDAQNFKQTIRLDHAVGNQIGTR